MVSVQERWQKKTDGKFSHFILSLVPSLFCITDYTANSSLCGYSIKECHERLLTAHVELKNPGTPGWLSWLSIGLPVSAQVMISRLHGLEPHIRLCAGITEPGWDSLSPSLSAPFPLMLSLSLSK